MRKVDCRHISSVTKHKPEINSGAADEIALAGGGVKEPAGFRNAPRYAMKSIIANITTSENEKDNE